MRTPGGPGRSANQSCAAPSPAGVGDRVGGPCPSPRTSPPAARPARRRRPGSRPATTASGSMPGRHPSVALARGHRRGPSARRRRVSARPSGESGRSHHDSTHQVAPASAHCCTGGRSPAERAVAVALDDDVVALHAEAGVRAQRPDAVDDLAQRLGGEVRVRGPRGCRRRSAGKTPCQRAARSSERCRGRPGTSMPTHQTGGCGLLHRHRGDELGHRPGAEVLAGELERLSAHQPRVDREHLVELGGAHGPPLVGLERQPVAVQRAEPDAERDPAPREPVDGGDPRGEVPRAGSARPG